MPKKSQSSAKKYTNPKLRERIKRKVKASDKAGEPGEWSARKAQLVAQEYKKEGGGYKTPRNSEQKRLRTWSESKPSTTKKKNTAKKKTKSG